MGTRSPTRNSDLIQRLERQFCDTNPIDTTSDASEKGIFSDRSAETLRKVYSSVTQIAPRDSYGGLTLQ